MSEAELLKAVIGLCREYYVTWFHDNDSRRNDAGFPDLVLVGQNGVAFVELKAEFGRMSSAQTIWFYRLLAAGQRHYLWRPSDLDSGQIADILYTL